MVDCDIAGWVGRWLVGKAGRLEVGNGWSVGWEVGIGLIFYFSF